jgi:ADP-heptose:LPS heptosyltransferase
MIADPKRVAVFRALGLGDLLCAVPVLRSLRRNWPAAEIVLVSLPWAREFADRFRDYVNRFYEFPGWPGLPERIPELSQIPRFLRQMQEERFDLAIQLHGSGRTVNELVGLFGARQMAGFAERGDYCPDPATFAPWPHIGLEIHRLLSLVRYLDLEAHGDHLNFPLTQEDFGLLARLPGADRIRPQNYAVIHPGASTPARQWPPERFAAAADHLAAQGLRIVLTGVTSEIPLVECVARSMRSDALRLAGRTELGTLGALIADAALVVTNDTGASHIAAALEVKSVVVSTANNPARWAPLDQRLHRVLCRPDGVSVSAVARAADELLELADTQEPAAERQRRLSGVGGAV